jgi:hypothetical protein
MRESRAPKRFGSYLAMVMSFTDSEPTTYEKVADILMKSLSRGKEVYFRDRL